MDAKPAFDPAQPFDAVASKPPFDPSKPFDAAPVDDGGAAAAQGARDVAASRVRQVQKPDRGRSQPTTLGDIAGGARDLVTQGATGFNEGVAHTVLRAADAVPYFVDRALGGEGVHPLENTFNKTFVEPIPQPSSDWQRITRAGGNMAGENLPFAVAAPAAAIKIPSLAFESAAPAAGNIWQTFKAGTRSFGDAMARNPTKAFIGDTTGAAEAGGGGEMWRQKAQDAGAGEAGQQRAEMAGQFAIPAGAAAYAKWGPSGMLRLGASKITDAVLKHTPESVLPESLRPSGGGPAARQADRLAFGNNEGKYAPNEGVNGVPTKELPVPPPKEPGYVARKMDEGAQARTDEAANVVAKDFGKITARPEVAANLAEADRLRAEIPGFEPGIAKASNDPALLNKQANFDSKAVNDELRARQEATDKSHGAIRTYMDNTVPPAGPNPQDRVAEVSKGRIQNEQTNLGAQADAVQGQIRAQSDALPKVDPTEPGNYVRETRDTLKGEADTHMSGLRKAVDPEGTAVVSVAGQKPMSVNAALDRRAQINQDLADHYGATNRDAAANKAIRELKAQKKALDTAIQSSSDAGTPGLKAYNDYYRDDYAPKYLQGASKQIGQFDRNGYEGNKVASEDVMAKFAGGKNISEARQFNKMFGENPEARQQMIDFKLDQLRREGVDKTTGELKKGSVDRFLAHNEDLMREMPWLREAISAKSPEALHRQLGELEQRQRAVADSKLGQLAKNGNPEAHIAAGLNDWQVMRDLKTSMGGDPQAEAALRRAVWDHVLGAAGGEGPINSEAIQKMLLPEAQGGHRRALAQVLTPQHLNNLENVMGATRIENRLDRPTGTYEKPKNFFSKFEEATGTSIPTLGATASALARGRSSPVYEVARLVGNMYRGISEREINAITKEALSNPEVAKQLAVVGKGGVATPMQLGRMRNYTLTLGIHDAEERAGAEPYKGPNLGPMQPK